jgi:phosphopantetheine binding protein
MGLDAVEFVMAIEAAFGVDIPDSVARELVTPGEVVDYLERRLIPSSQTTEAENSPICLEQRAFYRIRRASVKLLGLPRSAIRPDTSWDQVLPVSEKREAWRALGDAVGAGTWPRPALWRMPETSTVGGTAKYLAILTPRSFWAETETWTRPAIKHVIVGLMREELGIKKFAWTDRFVRDLHVD